MTQSNLEENDIISSQFNPIPQITPQKSSLSSTKWLQCRTQPDPGQGEVHGNAKKSNILADVHVGIHAAFSQFELKRC